MRSVTKNGLFYKSYRWFLFFVVGIPIQQIVIALHAIALPYFWFYARKKTWGSPPVVPPRKWTLKELKMLGFSDRIRDEYFLDYHDVHAALIHMYTWGLRPQLAQGGLVLLIREDGGLRRKFPADDWIPVSGDCLASWVRSYVEYGGHKFYLRKLAKHYLSNCMGLSAEGNKDFPKNRVSLRSSNGGVNYVPDGWLGINQPAMGPQVLGSGALFLLAAKELGGVWWLVYYAHALLMGQWFFALFPVMYPHMNHLYAAQHVTILNASALYRLSGNWLYAWSCRWTCDWISPHHKINPLFACWIPELFTPEEIEQCLFDLQRLKHVWPQHFPGHSKWYQWDDDKSQYSVAAGAAELIQKHLR